VQTAPRTVHLQEVSFRLRFSWTTQDGDTARAGLHRTKIMNVVCTCIFILFINAVKIGYNFGGKEEVTKNTDEKYGIIRKTFSLFRFFDFIACAV
jgi:phosphate starvation-inducible membrane PsiE